MFHFIIRLKKRAVFITMALFFVVVNSLGQTHFDVIESAPADASFKEVASRVDKFFISNPKVKGRKQWERWKWYAERHLDNDGKVGNVTARNMQALEQLNIDTRSFGPGNSGESANKINGDWSAIGPTNITPASQNYLGRVNCLAFHPTIANTIYAGTPGGGLWRSTTNGTFWAPLTDGLPSSGISGIVIQPNNANIMYILTGDGNGGTSWGYYVKERGCGVYKSTDGGTTWQQTGLNWQQSDIKAGYKLIIHPTNFNILLAATSDGIYRTLDAGVNWTKEISGEFQDIEFKADDPTKLCATRRIIASLYVSTNTGDTWTAKTIPGGAVSRAEAAVSPANPGLVYLMLGPQNTGGYRGFYTYNWSTEVFTLINNSPNVFTGDVTGADNGGFPWWCIGLWVSPTNTNNMLMGGVIGRRSTNGGATWFADNDIMHADNHGFYFNPLNNQVFAVNDGGIFMSTNNGDTWNNITGYLQMTQYYRMSGIDANANYILAGAQDNGHHLRKTNTSTFTQPFGNDGMDNGINYNNTEIMYALSQYGGLVKSTNGGTSFNGIFPSLAIPNQGEPWVVPFLIHTTTPSTLFYASLNGLLRHTADGEPTNGWTNLGGGGSTADFAMGTSNTNRGYLASATTIQRTDNLSAASPTWTLQSGKPGWPSLGGAQITSVDVNPATSFEVWVAFSGYNGNVKVLRSTDAGENWTNETDNLPNIPVHVIKYQRNSGVPGSVYIGTDLGVFYRNDDIGQWIMFGNDLPKTIVTDIELNETANVITACTYGRGIWRSPLYSSCDASLNLASSMTGDQYQQAASTISVTGDIIGGAGTRIFLKAGSYINFNAGFEIKAGNEMKAFIGPCTTDDPVFFSGGTGTPIVIPQEKAAEKVIRKVPEKEQQ